MVVDVNPLVESLTAIIAGPIVSLLNRYVFNNPSCQIGQECQVVEREPSESDHSNSSTVASSVVVTDSTVNHTHISH